MIDLLYLKSYPRSIKYNIMTMEVYVTRSPAIECFSRYKYHTQEKESLLIMLARNRSPNKGEEGAYLSLVFTRY